MWSEGRGGREGGECVSVRVGDGEGGGCVCVYGTSSLPFFSSILEYVHKHSDT